ncbi:MAG TPA: transporter substrate-binding domain-containing protein [Geobacteraceae bacterium]|nr:transporter substrate-binding domain-containing protein [Geobacteraceae bacterium]
MLTVIRTLSILPVSLVLLVFLATSFPVGAATLQLTPEEQAWLHAHPVVRLGFDSAYPPFEFSAQNSYQGMASDYILLLAERLGIGIQPVFGLSWKETLERLKTRTGVDAVALITRDKSRESFIEFTQDYISFPAVLFTRKDSRFISGIRDLSDSVIASERSYIGTDWLRRDVPRAKILETDTTVEALKSVATGKAEAYLGNLAVVSYLIEKEGFVDLKVAAPSPYPDDAYAMGVRKDWPEFARILDKALASVSEEEHRQIRQKWFAVRYEHGLRPLDIALWVTIVAGILAVFIVQLRRMVRQKTAELQKSLLQLEDAYRKLADIIEFLPDATYVLDREGRVLAWNHAIEEMTGISKDEMIGKGEQTYTIPFFGVPRPALADMILGRLELNAYQYKSFRKRGENLAAIVETPALYGGRGAYLSVTASPLTDHTGNLVGAIESLRDVTSLSKAEEEIRTLNEQLELRVQQRTAELERAQEELRVMNVDLSSRGQSLEEANHKLEAFAYSVSHDLRAPLRHIKSYTGLLIAEHADRLAAEGQHLLNRISVSCQRMDGLISAMLCLAQSSRQELNRQPVDMNRLVREVLAELPLESVNVELQDLPPCKADPVLIKQVYANLLENALKYCCGREAAKIEIGAGRKDGTTVYHVRDNGVGFDMAFADKLFDAFQRLHSSSDFEGVGIGLAIVRTIIQRHGGTIQAEGVPDGGACFSFTIPDAT